VKEGLWLAALSCETRCKGGRGFDQGTEKRPGETGETGETIARS